MLFFAGGVRLLESPLSSKAHCDNKFRQRKMSSLCIMGAVWFGAPEGISEYVSTVINQRDTRAEMTLFIWFYSQKSFHVWKHCAFSWLCIGKYIFLARRMSPFAECVMCFFSFFQRQSTCAQYTADKREEERMCDHLIRAAKYRDHVTAMQLIQKIVNILTDKHGAWGSIPTR